MSLCELARWPLLLLPTTIMYTAVHSSVALEASNASGSSCYRISGVGVCGAVRVLILGFSTEQKGCNQPSGFHPKLPRPNKSRRTLKSFTRKSNLGPLRGPPNPNNPKPLRAERLNAPRTLDSPTSLEPPSNPQTLKPSNPQTPKPPKPQTSTEQ